MVESEADLESAVDRALTVGAPREPSALHELARRVVGELSYGVSEHDTLHPKSPAQLLRRLEAHFDGDPGELPTHLIDQEWIRQETKRGRTLSRGLATKEADFDVVRFSSALLGTAESTVNIHVGIESPDLEALSRHDDNDHMGLDVPQQLKDPARLAEELRYQVHADPLHSLDVLCIWPSVPQPQMLMALDEALRPASVVLPALTPDRIDASVAALRARGYRVIAVERDGEVGRRQEWRVVDYVPSERAASIDLVGFVSVPSGKKLRNMLRVGAEGTLRERRRPRVVRLETDLDYQRLAGWLIQDRPAVAEAARAIVWTYRQSRSGRSDVALLAGGFAVGAMAALAGGRRKHLPTVVGGGAVALVGFTGLLGRFARETVDIPGVADWRRWFGVQS